MSYLSLGASSAYLYNGYPAWYNVVLTARSLKREIQITGELQSANICDVSNQPFYA